MTLTAAPARRAATIIFALALTGMLPSAAQAKVDITGFVAKPIAANASCSTSTSAPAEPQAGANKDFCVAMALDGGGDAFGGGDDMRELRMSLPPGQVGGATATPTCSISRFNSLSGCPTSTQVGEASGRIEALITLPENVIRGQIFNITPRGSEAARLGIQLEFAGLFSVQRVEAVATLRSEGGLDALSVGLPNSVVGLPIEIRRFNLKLWGSKADHPSLGTSFIVNPTDCSKPATSSLGIRSSRGVDTTATASYQPTGCDKLQFTPAMILEGDHAADSPGVLTAGMRFPAQSGPLAQARVRTASVVLPQGYELSASQGSEPGFVGCSDEQFARTSTAPAQCPAGSKIGTVRFSTPLIAAPLDGDVYIAEQRSGESPIRIFIFSQTGPAAEAVRVKLTADVVPDPKTGQITTTLKELPAVPFSAFRLSFRGGPTAIIAAPRSCGTRTGSVVVVPDNGGAAAVPTAELTVDKGCGDPARFTPELQTSLTETQAGAPTALTANLVRPDGHARLAGAKISLPAGFAGRLTAAEQCTVASARASTCGPDSRIGKVRVLAGPGSVPAPIDGNVYLTEPQSPGDLAGLAIIVPAQFGPLSFGDLITLARIVVRPEIGLDIVVPEIPQRVYGIDVNLREMKLTLDREGFGLNATSCAPTAATGTLVSDLGATAEVSSPYQATGCENVRYEPTLAATLLGSRAETETNGHPALNTVIGAGLGQGGTKSVELVLPDGLSVDVDRIKRACPLASYQAGTCKADAIVGDAVAESPLIATALKGNVTFVSVPGAPLPELRIDLRGPLAITVSGKIRQQGRRLLAEISGLPDTPLTSFELTLAGGERGLLQASRDLCSTATLPIDAQFDSFTGARVKRTVPTAIPNCAPAATVKLGSLKTGKPTFDLRVSGGRTAVSSTQLTLPTGLTFGSSQAVRRLVRVSATGLPRGARATLTVRGRTLRLTVPKGQAATVLRVRMRAGALRVSQQLRRAGRPKLSFRLQTNRPDGTRTALRVSARPAG